jgi:DNA processing protein
MYAAHKALLNFFQRQILTKNRLTTSRPMPQTEWTPSRLSELYIRGAPLADELRVSVVGTRRITSYGRHATKLIVTELARHRITIVSGLAIGIDGAAHEACLDAGGKTIAVLPGGVDDASIVPPRHRDLARRIVDAGGSIVSEHPPGWEVRPWSFLQRNRIIAALSSATIVVEADHDSGSLVTAKEALDAGREVLAVPGPIWSEGSRGTNNLIKQGARPCTNADDVFAALGFGKPENARKIQEARATIPVSDDEAIILAAFTEPHTVDEIARITSKPVTQVNALMSMLELKGRIISVGPRTYAKAR